MGRDVTEFINKLGNILVTKLVIFLVVAFAFI